MQSITELPKRGWATLRMPTALVYVYQVAGLIKAQTTPTKDVFHARLTGAGRKYVDNLLSSQTPTDRKVK